MQQGLGSEHDCLRQQKPQPFTGRGLAHFSGRVGLKKSACPLCPEGDSPIFADFAVKIGTVPVKGYQKPNRGDGKHGAGSMEPHLTW
jgi:hypothetical protein